MTRLADESLPGEILSRLQGPLEGRAHEVILAFGVDDEGWPHAAMLSPLELVALDGGHIRAALYSTSSFVRHVRQRPQVTLVFVWRELACYVKAEARLLAPEIPGMPGLTAIALRVRRVLVDEADPDREGAGTLESGITYRRLDAAGDVARARRLLDTLEKM